MSHTSFVSAKKLLAMLSVAGYFFAVNCRFVCAMGIPDVSPVMAEQRDASAAGACHHQDESENQSDGQKDQSASCCSAHVDGDFVLLPAGVTLQDVSALIAVLPNAVSKNLLPSPRLPSFWEDRGPPLIISQVLASSSRGPRAPPFPTVVL